LTDRRLQKGGMTFSSTRNSTYTDPHIHTTAILDYNMRTWLQIQKVGLMSHHSTQVSQWQSLIRHDSNSEFWKYEYKKNT
jgi:hypothetical protein